MKYKDDNGTEYECDESLGKALGFTYVGESDAPATPEDTDTPQDTDGAPQGHLESDGGTEESGDEVPEGSAEDVIAWVAGDRGRADRAVEAEKARSKPRKGLLAELNDVK